jgi:hypothetical protein
MRTGRVDRPSRSRSRCRSVVYRRCIVSPPRCTRGTRPCCTGNRCKPCRSSSARSRRTSAPCCSSIASGNRGRTRRRTCSSPCRIRTCRRRRRPSARSHHTSAPCSRCIASCPARSRRRNFRRRTRSCSASAVGWCPSCHTDKVCCRLRSLACPADTSHRPWSVRRHHTQMDRRSRRARFLGDRTAGSPLQMACSAGRVLDKEPSKGRSRRRRGVGRRDRALDPRKRSYSRCTFAAGRSHCSACCSPRRQPHRRQRRHHFRRSLTRRPLRRTHLTMTRRRLRPCLLHHQRPVAKEGTQSRPRPRWRDRRGNAARVGG